MRLKRPSLQELENLRINTEVIRQLYRECLQTALIYGKKTGNTDDLVQMVRRSFYRNIYETNPRKIEAVRRRAIRDFAKYVCIQTGILTKTKSGKYTSVRFIEQNGPEGMGPEDFKYIEDRSLETDSDPDAEF